VLGRITLIVAGILFLAVQPAEVTAKPRHGAAGKRPGDRAADNKRTQRQAHLERGIKLLNDMEDARSLEAFEAALKEAGGSTPEQAKIHAYMGIAYFNLLKKEQARASFNSALKLDPTIGLPGSISPKIQEFFDKVKAEVVAAREAARQAELERERREAARRRRAAKLKKKESRSGLRISAWATMGAAVAAAGGGTAFALLAKSERDKAEDLSIPYRAALEHNDRAKSRALAANILFGVAGAAAVTSAVLFYFGYRRVNEVKAAVVPLPSGAMVQVGGVTW
jgi:tetratricopeptide (TPR) repeat protein